MKDPRWSYKQNIDAIISAERRFYEPPTDYCHCEPECEDYKTHKAKADDAEQRNNDAVYERERERRIK